MITFQDLPGYATTQTWSYPLSVYDFYSVTDLNACGEGKRSSQNAVVNGCETGQGCCGTTVCAHRVVAKTLDGRVTVGRCTLGFVDISNRVSEIGAQFAARFAEGGGPSLRTVERSGRKVKRLYRWRHSDDRIWQKASSTEIWRTRLSSWKKGLIE